MPADPTPPPTEAELATLTPEERGLYRHMQEMSMLPIPNAQDALDLLAVFADLMRLRLAARPRPMEEAPFDVWILCEHIATGDWRRLRRLRGSEMLFDLVGSVGDHSAFPRWMPAPPQPEPDAKHAGGKSDA